ncbi:MAG: hypothetical protein HRU33_16055 [Rhodobacteraceae bacterium]|nr:hypothetical protein [Paracoccaceae bacterium]
MAKTDFQDRLQRITANAPQQQPMAQGRSPTGRTGARKLSVIQLVVGAIIMKVGKDVVKFANENYDAIRDDAGVTAAAGLGFAGTVILLFGLFMMFREISKWWAGPAEAVAPQRSAKVAQPARQASNRAKLICSLLGFGLGMIAILYLFLAAAAGGIETEKARIFANGGLLIAALLFVVVSFIGIVGLFLRGYALGRVPVYFVIGAGLTFAVIRIFRMDILEVQQFTGLLQ